MCFSTVTKEFLKKEASMLDDPIWSAERICRFEESVPILAAGWGEEFGAGRATVLVSRSSHIEAVFTLHHGTLCFLATPSSYSFTKRWGCM